MSVTEMTEARARLLAWRSLRDAVPADGEVVVVQMRPDRGSLSERAVLARREGAWLKMSGKPESIRGLIARGEHGGVVPVWCRLPAPADMDAGDARVEIARLEGEVRSLRARLEERETVLRAREERVAVSSGRTVSSAVLFVLSLDARTLGTPRELRFRRFSGQWLLQRLRAVHYPGGARRNEWVTVEECGYAALPYGSAEVVDACDAEWDRISAAEVQR